MNSSIGRSIDSELFFMIKYHIYAFFYYKKIFPKQCFYFDDYMTDRNYNTVSLPTLYSTFIADEKNSIQEWLTKLKKLISKKKILKIVINCYNPRIERPIKQLVIDFHDNYQHTLFNKDSTESAINEIRCHKFNYLSKLLTKYKSFEDNKCFYDIEDATINMKFVYKNRSKLKFSNDNVQPFIKKNYTDLRYKYINCCICSRINTFEDQKYESDERSITKKRSIISSVELVKKDTNVDYVYSEIEESDFEKAPFNESATKIDHGNIYLDF